MAARERKGGEVSSILKGKRERQRGLNEPEGWKDFQMEELKYIWKKGKKGSRSQWTSRVRNMKTRGEELELTSPA